MIMIALFDGPSGKAAQERALEDEKEDDFRQHHEGGCHVHQVPLRIMRALVETEPDGEGVFALVLQVDERTEEVTGDLSAGGVFIAP